MNLMPEYDLKELFEILSANGLENKPVCTMNKNEVINLIEIIKDLAPMRCLHCVQFRPETRRGIKGVCEISGLCVDNALDFCIIERDRVPF